MNEQTSSSSASRASSRIYVTSVSASPVGPTNFNTNVQPVVYVADLAARSEVRDAFGTTNLAKPVAEQIPAGGERLFLADLAGIRAECRAHRLHGVHRR